jgi:hypothetical protein
MKFAKFIGVAIAALAISIGSAAFAETVHQTVNADKLFTGDGGSAVAKGVMETKKVPGAEAGEVARVKGNMVQWGFVTAWFGVPTPAGKSVIRIRVYKEAGQKVAKYMLYIAGQSGKSGFGELKIPDDAKDNTFVNIDIPINVNKEWNGLTIKKADKSDLPSLWIDTVSIVLPD